LPTAGAAAEGNLRSLLLGGLSVGTDQRPNIVFGDAAHRGLAECRKKVFAKTALQFSIAIFPRHAIQQPRLG
jgi:hypothetical protein